MKDKSHIILAGGGTGGHFFPAVAVAEVINKQGAEHAIIIADQRCEKYTQAINDSIKVEILQLARPIRTIEGIIKFIYSALAATFLAMKLLKKYQPKLVVGFGGYPSFPPLLAAWLMRVPIALHEQNSFLGLVNQLFASSAKFIALSFAETIKLKSNYLAKTVVTGNPIRVSELNQAEVKKREGKFTLLITGGSQGAKIFSTIVPGALRLLRTLQPDQSLCVYHQVAGEDIEEVTSIYKELKIEHYVADFFYNINTLYAEADLYIGRAGASTIAELQAMKLPAILIPYPHAAHDHQSFNARAMEKLGIAWVLYQDKLRVESLAKQLEVIMTNLTILDEMHNNFPVPKQIPAEAVAGLINSAI